MSENEARLIPEIDRVIHEPARLAILTVLASCQEADFLFLERATGLSRGNLSVQLTRLEEVGMIEIEKRIEHKRTLTTASLSKNGRRGLRSYWESMDALRGFVGGVAASGAEKSKRRRGLPGRLAPAES